MGNDATADLRHVALAFLKHKQWPIFGTEDANVFCTVFKGENGQWQVYVQCHPEQPMFVVYSLFPKTCPAERESELIELIARLNDGLMIGNFEYSFAHKELRFKTGINATHMDMKLEICDSPFYYNLLSMDQYYEAIESVMNGKSAAEILN